MSIASQLGRRFKAEFTAKIIAVVSGGILTVALARLLDPDGYGLLFLAISVLGFVELFSKLGIAKATARYIAKYKETEPGQIPHILKFGFTLNLASILITCAIFVIVFEDVALLIGEPELRPFLLLGTLYIASHTTITFFRYSLQGFEDIEQSAVVLSTDRISRLILALGLVLLGYGALGALVGYILAFAVASMLGFVILYKSYYNKYSKARRESGIRRRIAKYTIPLIATNSSNVLDKRVDTILLGFFIGPSAVAFYTVSKQVITFIEAPMTALGFTLSPTYEAQKAKGNIDTAGKIYKEALIHGVLLYIPAAVGLILVADPFITIIFGFQYIEAVPVLQILAVYAVLRSITKLTSNGLDYLGRARERAIIKGFTSTSNVILNIILIPILGVVGAALATVITYSIYAFANFYIMSKELNIGVHWIIHGGKNTLIATLPMVLIVYPALNFVSGILTLIGVVGLGAMVWTITIVRLGAIDVKQIYSVVSNQ